MTYKKDYYREVLKTFVELLKDIPDVKNTGIVINGDTETEKLEQTAVKCKEVLPTTEFFFMAGSASADVIVKCASIDIEECAIGIDKFTELIGLSEEVE